MGGEFVGVSAFLLFQIIIGWIGVTISPMFDSIMVTNVLHRADEVVVDRT
jgi:hypothetical protein